MFSGSIVALITPYNQGKVDRQALVNLVEWHIQEETQAIVVAGSTGEGVLLTASERHQLLKITLDVARQRIPVIAGCGSPSTSEVISMVQDAENLGAAAALVVTPYYVKPSLEGVYQHFKAIGQACALPLLVYNNPGRCGLDLSIDHITRLATLPAVIGLKDSSTDSTRPLHLRQAISRPFCLLSGDDPTASVYLVNGGDGCISVTANVAPWLCQQMMQAWKNQDGMAFNRLRDCLAPLHEALLVETNPSPVKFGVSLLGKCQPDVRLPLVPVSQNTQERIRQAMISAGVLAKDIQGDPVN